MHGSGHKYKALFQLDPLTPLTQAGAKKSGGDETPFPSFVRSQNSRAAALLFTPHKKTQFLLPQASPTPEPSSTYGAESDEDSMDIPLERLSLESHPGPELEGGKGKKKEVAHDVWEFFDKGTGRKDNRTCKLCM
jgi:hypothetical protein